MIKNSSYKLSKKTSLRCLLFLSFFPIVLVGTPPAYDPLSVGLVLETTEEALQPQYSSDFKSKLFNLISDSIIKDREINKKVAETIRTEIIKPLETKEFVKLSGDKVRAPTVTFQAYFEEAAIQLLNSNEVTRLVGIIHTANPTTPLCVPEKGDPKDIMDSKLATDPATVKTVRDRSVTMRALIKNGNNATIYITYPTEGLKARSKIQQKIYLSEVNNKANIGLRDIKLTTKTCHKEISGATYILTLKNGKKFVFSINSTQVNNPNDSINWRIWMGDSTEDTIFNRVDAVLTYLKNGGLDLKEAI